MVALPTDHGDTDAWGSKLNNWLLTGHFADGQRIWTPNDIITPNWQLNIHQRGTLSGAVTDGQLLLDKIRANLGTGSSATFNSSDSTQKLVSTFNTVSVVHTRGG